MQLQETGWRTQMLGVHYHSLVFHDGMLVSAGQDLAYHSTGSSLSILMQGRQMVTERRHVEGVELRQTVHSLRRSPVVDEQRSTLKTAVDSLAEVVGIPAQRRQSGLLGVHMSKEAEAEWHQLAHMECQEQTP
jgi:hypothetical protein